MFDVVGKKRRSSWRSPRQGYAATCRSEEHLLLLITAVLVVGGFKDIHVGLPLERKCALEFFLLFSIIPSLFSGGIIYYHRST